MNSFKKHIKQPVKLIAALSLALALPLSANAGTNQIIVNSTDDVIDEFNGTCSLREAIRNANNNTSSPIAGECEAGSATLTDVIVLTSGETYQLTLANNANNPNETGDLDIDQSEAIVTALRIETSDVGRATIRQTVNGQRVMENHNNGVELHNLTLTGGNLDGAGGGILNENGILNMTSMSVLSNSATAGGGVYNSGGSVHVADSEFILNNATFIGGGSIFNTGSDGVVEVENSLIRVNTAPDGGGIYSNGGMVVVDSESTINLNDATNGNGGAIVNLADSELIVRSSSFEGNTAQDNGGAIYSESSKVTLIEDSSFDDHNATLGGAICTTSSANLIINRSTFMNNSSASDGGAIYASFVDLTQSHLEGNESFLGNGGAIRGIVGGKILDNSIIRGNNAENGGGLYVQVLTLLDSKVENNTATNNGGGVFISNKASLVRNASITGNSAPNGGGIYLRELSPSISEFQQLLVTQNMADSDGGGMWLGSDANIGNTTIVSNIATNGGGLYIAEASDVSATNITLSGNLSGQDLHKYGNLTLQNSIISTTDQPDCLMGLNNPSIISLGNNIADDASCFGLDEPTDMINTNPMLEGLADNGGDTLTSALAVGSPAINNGNAVACGADPVFNVDQRGASRLNNDNCDIGAYESDGLLDTIFKNGFEQ